MLYRCVSIFIIFIALTGSSASIADSVSEGLRISFVDADNKKTNAEAVRWWVVEKPGNKFELPCFNGQCDRRFLEGERPGAIVISASTTVIDPEDAACWKLYHGEIVINVPVEKVKIVLRYKNIICK